MGEEKSLCRALGPETFNEPRLFFFLLAWTKTDSTRAHACNLLTVDVLIMLPDHYSAFLARLGE